MRVGQGEYSRENLEELLNKLPEGLASSFNLGMADVYPANSGKKNAALYLMRHFGSHPDSCCFLCDDDNDIGIRIYN